ncbi:MAG: hypothetical protein CFE44_18990, partial [Burkholderiales bacterium PBB4]
MNRRITTPPTPSSARFRLNTALAWLPVVGAMWGLMPCAIQAQQSNAQPTQAIESAPAVTNGPLRLRQPVQASGSQPANNERLASEQPLVPYRPGEFEVYVQSLAGRSAEEIRRFGSELITGASGASLANDFNPLIPSDYIVQPGDELLLTMWGSIDADLRLQVDRSGRIAVPRVGPILVAGTRYADLGDVISKRAGLVFKNFQLSASLGQLRGIRIYVTGVVHRPGVQVVSSLATLAQAVMKAGGPSASGSFRNVQLRRGGSVVSTFDLYDLLLKGDRGADRLVQADDVVHVGPV